MATNNDSDGAPINGCKPHKLISLHQSLGNRVYRINARQVLSRHVRDNQSYRCRSCSCDQMCIIVM